MFYQYIRCQYIVTCLERYNKNPEAENAHILDDQSATMTLLWLLSLLCVLGVVAGKKNVLFLVSDDLRPSIGAYEGPDMPSQFDPKMHTPSLDGLAAKSMLMKRAYVQYAVSRHGRSSKEPLLKIRVDDAI